MLPALSARAVDTGSTPTRPQAVGPPIVRVAVAVTAVASVVIVAAGVRGADYPAQVFRVRLFQQAGFTLWNSTWYAGHYTVGYSILFPPLAAWLGIATVAIASSVAGVAAFAALVRPLYGRAAAWATAWFVVATIVNLVIGRLTFGLGAAFGVASVLAMQRRKSALAVVLALLTTLGSPVAGVFVAIAATAVAIDRWLDGDRRARSSRLRVALLMSAAALVPILAISAAFRATGYFPFRGGHFVGSLAAGFGLAALLPRRQRAVRIGAALFALAAIPVFFVANPLGGNMVRLPTMLTWPLLAGALWLPHRRLVLTAAIPLGIWLLVPVIPPLTAYGNADGNHSYYEPLVDYVENTPGAPGRIEIPFTEDHWEAAYVAPDLPLARGWERQVDLSENRLFYDGSLSAATYRAWVLDKAVRWIAVPDAEFDHGGAAEAALVRSGDLEWLRPVWHDQHWQLFEVIGANPIVEPPGRLVEARPDGMTIVIDRPGTVLVRERYTPFWTVDGAGTCVSESSSGWTVIEATRAGRVELRAALSFGAVLGRSAGDGC